MNSIYYFYKNITDSSVTPFSRATSSNLEEELKMKEISLRRFWGVTQNKIRIGNR